jgi:hypothetical protein
MFTSAVVNIVVKNTIFRKAPPSVVSGYDKQSINLNKVVATVPITTDVVSSNLNQGEVHVQQ